MRRGLLFSGKASNPQSYPQICEHNPQSSALFLPKNLIEKIQRMPILTVNTPGASSQILSAYASVFFCLDHNHSKSDTF